MPDDQPPPRSPTPAPPARPPVPTGPILFAGCATLGTIGALCCSGVLAVSLRAGLATAEHELKNDLRELETEREADEVAASVLDEMEERLRAQRMADGRFPPSLAEPPPEDPWGTPLRYENEGPDLAWVTSAGPDRRFDTEDDLVRDLSN